MTRCRHCGARYTRRRLSDRYCADCAPRVAELEAPREVTGFVPTWRRRDLGRDESGRVLVG